MVKCQILRGTFLATVLAGMVVPSINISPAELYMLETLSDLYVLQQPQNARHLNSETDATNFTIVFRQHFNLALAEQVQRPLPGNNIDRFISSV